jgi:hypothetical protein
LSEGTNDIAGGAAAGELIAALQKVIDRVHQHGLPIIGVAVVSKGRPPSIPGWDEYRENERIGVNGSIRDGSLKFDAILDFDQVLAGPCLMVRSQ